MRRREQGSASVELAVLTPLLILLALLTVLAYRMVAAEMTANTLAHAAARAATLQRTPAAAEQAARQSVANALRTHDLDCAAYSLELDIAGLEPGATVDAALTCHVDLAGLSGLGVPLTSEVRGEASAVVDVYRSGP
ncbi:TadE/TadG family type IV pilus assembly protein [Streptomonospora halophila]|uniref:TadE/TadG family type IV pilus assembly protein n=1 Tax=Streptomonospora halophila TaxID=427369 RepID=UPI0031E92497